MPASYSVFKVDKVVNAYEMVLNVQANSKDEREIAVLL